jgi:hypothetical protein
MPLPGLMVRSGLPPKVDSSAKTPYSSQQIVDIGKFDFEGH